MTALALPLFPGRVQRHRTRGWRMPAGSVYVGRPTKWGNPYRVVWSGGDSFAIWVESRSLEQHTDQASALRRVVELYQDHAASLAAAARDELAGKTLVCWCPADVPCHADVLLALANDVDCLHPGDHTRPLNCPDCGRFSAHSWQTRWFYTQNGGQQSWGGTCARHGEWSEDAA